MHQSAVGYAWDDVEALKAHQRIHVKNDLIFAFTDELQLVAVPDTNDPRYVPDYGNTQSAAWDELRDHIERQNDPATRRRYAEEAAALLIEAQSWLDDPHNRYKPSAQDLLRYNGGQWRKDYGILLREGDENYGWPAPNGAFYVLIARGGRVVAIVREYPEQMRRTSAD